MITFKEFISESINDKGKFKAIFIIGLPGAGKSYTITHLSGSIAPKIVNSDRATEFFIRKYGYKLGLSFENYKDQTKLLTKKSLKNYLNSMLPLFVDSTSGNLSQIQHRMGILESIGYDVGVIYIKTNLHTALERAEKRNAKGGRQVDMEFIKQVNKESDENAEYLKAKTHFFKEIENNSESIDNQVFEKVFKSCQSFLNSDIQNPIGSRSLEKLIDAKEGYLVPTVLSEEILDKKVDGWYKD
jgi:shikimate kinase